MKAQQYLASIRVVVLAALLVGSVQAQEPQLRAWIDTPAAQRGDSVWVQVHFGLDGTPAPDLLGVGFKLNYDGDRLVYLDHESGTLFQAALAAQQGDEVGPVVQGLAAGEEPALAYSVTLFDGETPALAAARGAVVRLRFRVVEAAPPGPFPFTLRDARRSTPDDPDIQVLRVKADHGVIEPGVQARRALIPADPPDPWHLPALGNLELRFTQWDRERLVTMERDRTYELEGTLPEAMVPAVTGSWRFSVEGPSGYAADVCVAYALVDEQVKAGRQADVRWVQEDGTGWTVLPTKLTPSAGAPVYVCGEVTRGGTLVAAAPATAVSVDEAGEVPRQAILEPNTPNPFSDRTMLRYHLPQAGPVHLAVYDLTGRRVATLVDEAQAPGTYTVTWEAGAQPPGVYLGRLRTATGTRVQPLLRVR